MKEINPAQAYEVNGGAAQSIPQDPASIDSLGADKTDPATTVPRQPLPEPL